jgi:hypothetical protein
MPKPAAIIIVLFVAAGTIFRLIHQSPFRRKKSR